MRIDSNHISNKPIHSADGARTVTGQSPFSPSENIASAKLVVSKSSPIRQEDLMALAKDFKNGLIDKDEANNRFVSTIVNGSIDGKLSEKDREVIAKNIAAFFSDDPEFMNKLQKNLKQLA